VTDGAFDDAVRRGDPDRWLASRFVGDPAARADLIVLYAFDLELARAQRVASTPLTAEIRLAWWAEAVAEIFAGGPVRAHPLVQSLADVIGRRDLDRTPLDAMIDARREAMFADAMDEAAAVAWADDVAGSAALLAGHRLDPGADDAPLRLAGRAFGVALLLRSGRLAPDVAVSLLRRSLADANAALPTLSPRAFPAVAHATLVRDDLSGRQGSELGRRFRLVAAVLRGRL
jgi:phytoene synthase